MNEFQQQTKAFIESECAKLNCASIATPLTEGYAAICESESDASIYKMAMDITNQFFDKETVGQIVEKFNDMEALSIFGKDEDFKVTKEITKPAHLIITAYLGQAEDPRHQGRSGVTYYGKPPRIVLYLSNHTGQLVHGHHRNDYGQNKKYPVTKDLLESWTDILVHEVSHALDQLMRRSNEYNSSTKSSLRQTKSYNYASDLLETNARIPQFAYLLADMALKNKGKGEFVPFKSAAETFNNKIMQFSFMSDDAKKRTLKRIFDIYSKFKTAWEQHKDEISNAADFMKFIDTKEMKEKAAKGRTAEEYLGKRATITTSNGLKLVLKKVENGFYQVVDGTHSSDIGLKVKFDPDVTVRGKKLYVFRILEAIRKDGSKAPYNMLNISNVEQSSEEQAENLNAEQLLGDKAEVLMNKKTGATMTLAKDSDGFYKAVDSTVKSLVGTKYKFEPDVTYSPLLHEYRFACEESFEADGSEGFVSGLHAYNIKKL